MMNVPGSETRHSANVLSKQAREEEESICLHDKVV